MKQLKIYTVIGSVFVLLTGTLAHFVYEWSGNNNTVGLFAPVNESVWEHMKLLFFPMLVYSVFMICKFRPDYPCIASSFLFGTLAGTLLIPVFFYGYTFILGKDVFLLDIITFILSILIAFLLSYRLTLSCKLKPHTLLLTIFVVIFGILFAVFTYQPPNLKIFEAPTPSSLSSPPQKSR